MSTDAAVRTEPLSPLEQLRYAQQIVQEEGRALLQIADGLDGRFCDAVQLLFQCRGSVLVTGMGKAGLVGQKITATLASTGTRSHYLHPGEAFHGDLGRIHADDLVLALSQSGETEEVVRLLPSLSEMGVSLLAITSAASSTLGRAADVTLELGEIVEACSLGLAPSTTTTAMMALGDALALVTSRQRNFRAEDFARFHPGGSLGRKLSHVEDHMRPIAECRLASEECTVREVFTQHAQPGRRSGAILLVSSDGRLEGIFTDSDLARLFEAHRDVALDRPIRDVMTGQPTAILAGSRMSDALHLIGQHKISELPVVAEDGRPIGLIDITDLAGMLPDSESSASKSAPTVRLFPKQDESEA